MAAALCQPSGADVSHIIDNIYLGAAPPRSLDGEGASIKAYLLEILRVGYVINVATPREQGPVGILPGVIYYQEFKVQDQPSAVNGRNLLRHIPECVKCIDASQKEGKAVFIHCLGGKSRSPTIVLGILLVRYKMPLKDSWELLRARRPVVYPQVEYFQELQKLEVRLVSALCDLFFTASPHTYQLAQNPTLREPTMSIEDYKCYWVPD